MTTWTKRPKYEGSPVVNYNDASINYNNALLNYYGQSITTWTNQTKS